MSAGTLPNQCEQLNSFAQDPEWLRVPEAVRRFGLGRSTLYELIRNREIKTALIRKRGNTTGRRLISTDSLRAFVERFVEGPCSRSRPSPPDVGFRKFLAPQMKSEK